MQKRIKICRLSFPEPSAFHGFPAPMIIIFWIWVIWVPYEYVWEWGIAQNCNFDGKTIKGTTFSDTPICSLKENQGPRPELHKSQGEQRLVAVHRLPNDWKCLDHRATLWRRQWGQPRGRRCLVFDGVLGEHFGNIFLGPLSVTIIQWERPKKTTQTKQHWTWEVFVYPIYAPEMLQYFKPVSLDIYGALEDAMPCYWGTATATSVMNSPQHSTSSSNMKSCSSRFFVFGDLVGGFIGVSCELFASQKLLYLPFRGPELVPWVAPSVSCRWPLTTLSTFAETGLCRSKLTSWKVSIIDYIIDDLGFF